MTRPSSSITILALLFTLLPAARVVHAGHGPAPAVVCTSASMTPVSFGSVNPLSTQTTTTATLTYTCTNTDHGHDYSATVCFSIGEPAGGPTNPRLMASGANSLQFQLYQDPTYSTVWGSQFFGTFLTPLVVNLALGKGATVTSTATLYAMVLPGQNPVPGSYSENFRNIDTAITVNSAKGGRPPGSCSSNAEGVYFPFPTTAFVGSNCTVSANNLNFGSVAAGATGVSGSSTISVNCSRNTPYYVGLRPSNGNSTGAGTMTAATPGNTGVVPYQLYSDPAMSTPWGNTATSTSVGNGLAGTGTGLPQSLTVYAKTGSTDVRPDSYSDTVTVTVNY